MAQLQFPANPQSGDTYTGDNNIVYTWNGAYWECYSTMSFVETAGDNMTGDLTLGSNASAPNITLDTDGNATFAGEIKGGNAKQLFVQNTTGGIFLKDTGNATAQDWKIKLDSSGAAFFGSGNITFTTGGSATFAGDSQSASQNTNSLAGFRNLLINGSMTFWQRGTSGAGTGYQGPDRWRSASDSPVVTRRTIAAGTGQAGVPATYSCEISTSGSSAGITQCIELPYGGGRQDGFDVGNQYTLSWYADTTNPAEFDVYTPAFVDESTGALNTVTAGTKGAIELIETMGSTGWGRFQCLITITGNVGQTNIALSVGVATLGNTHQVTSIQFEPGPVATPFELRPIGTELALCQRYYSRVEVSGGSYPGVYWDGSEVYYGQFISFPVTMRALPNFVNFVSVVGNFMWVNPGQYGTSDPSTDGISFSFSPYSFALRQDRIGTGTVPPTPGLTYILEGAFTVEADAEL